LGSNEDVARIAQQEAELVFEKFDADTAWDLGSSIRAIAAARKFAIAIDVRRFGGGRLFFAAMEGTAPTNAEWVRRKSNTVEMMLKSSYRIGLENKIKRTTLVEKAALAPGDYIDAGGSFPLTVRAAGVIGAVTVSGLPQRKDHETVVEALCLFLGKDYSGLKLGDEVGGAA
jgi:uncharacterized protein (UPF0303 family)